MKATFDHLSESKRQLVIEGCIDEFGEYGYEKGSTDGIVKRSGISKGGLYEYTRSKEELFLFIVDYSYGHLYSFIKEKVRAGGRKMPPDILERLRLVSSVAIDFYLEHPKEIQVIVKAGRLEGLEMAEKVQKIFLGHFMDVFGDSDTSGLRFSKDWLLDILRWMLAKTRNDFLAEAAKTGDVVKVRKAYLKDWDQILSVFKNGIYKERMELNKR